MRSVLAVSVCLLVATSVFAQRADEEFETGGVAKTTLARKEKDGTITENPPFFAPGDVPIICYVDLTTTGSVEVKLVIVAVKAVGLRPNSVIVTVRYKTGDGDNLVEFTARPKGRWAAGEYRADILLDGKRADARVFKVSGK